MGNPSSFVSAASVDDVNTFTATQTFTAEVMLAGGSLLAGDVQVDGTDASGTPE